MTFIPLATAIFVIIIAFAATIIKWFHNHEAWLERQKDKTSTLDKVSMLEDVEQTKGTVGDVDVDVDDDPKVWYHQGTYMFIWALAIIAWAICAVIVVCAIIVIAGGAIMSISRGLDSTHYYYVNGYWEGTWSSEFFGGYNNTRWRELNGLSPLKDGQWTFWIEGREIIVDAPGESLIQEGRLSGNIETAKDSPNDDLTFSIGFPQRIQEMARNAEPTPVHIHTQEQEQQGSVNE